MWRFKLCLVAILVPGIAGILSVPILAQEVADRGDDSTHAAPAVDAGGLPLDATAGNQGSNQPSNKGAKKQHAAKKRSHKKRALGKPGDRQDNQASVANKGGKKVAGHAASTNVLHRERLDLPGGLVLTIKIVQQPQRTPASKQMRRPAAPKQDHAGRDARRQQLLARFDANGNGQLDPEEREAARKAMQALKQKRGGKGKPDGGKGQANGGQGQVGPGGQAWREQLLARFDANGNGQLDPEEREAARKAMQALKQKRGGKGKPDGGKGKRPADKQQGDKAGINQPGEEAPASDAASPDRPRRRGAAAEEPPRESELERRLIERFDANGNGRLDDDERRAARKALAERQRQPGA